MSVLSDMRLNRISLTVRDVDQTIRFYTERLGMRHLSGTGPQYELGFKGQPPMLELVQDDQARIRPASAPGLFHVAYLYPTRSDLAGALHHLASTGWPLQGAADHGVSEAIYLADPEGNGIELYVDRPKSDWPYRNGSLQMVTEALDLDDLLSTRSEDQPVSSPTIGHVHLQASSLESAEEFWCGTIGLDATQKNFPGALFASAGGYHHHLGLNTWRSEGQRLEEGAWTGLRSINISIPDEGELSGIRSRFKDGQERDPGTLITTFETTAIHIHSSNDQ